MGLLEHNLDNRVTLVAAHCSESRLRYHKTVFLPGLEMKKRACQVPARHEEFPWRTQRRHREVKDTSC